MALIRTQAGFTLIETLVVLAIVAMLVGMGGVWAQQATEYQLVSLVGEHQKAVAQATNQYIRDNYPMVLSQVRAKSPLTISFNELTNKAILPSGFASTNAFGQAYRIVVIEPQPNRLHTLIVTEGGEGIEERLLRKMVGHLGAGGGRISNQDAAGNIDASLVNSVQGANGGWTVSLSQYGVSPGVGHLASAIFHQDGQEVENYLHRKAIAGKPELNQMTTVLDMGGNDIKNSGVVKGQSAELAGWVTAQDGTFRSSVTAKTVQAEQLNANNVWGNAIGGNSVSINGHLSAGSAGVANSLWAGSIQSNSIRSNGRLSTGEFLQLDGVANVGWGCSPNGLVAKDGQGGLLSCRLGVWTAAGGVSDVMVSPLLSHTGTIWLGQYKVCTLSRVAMDRLNWKNCHVSQANGAWSLNAHVYSGNEVRCQAVCFN